MKKTLALLFVLFLAGTVFAQSADVVSKILDAEEVTYGQVCYLSAVHQNLVSDDASFETSIKALFDAGQLPQEVDSNQVVYKANLAFIYMQMFPNVKGGLFYRLTKGSPRYAFKQMKADGIYSDKTDPKDVCSGAEALDILSACMFEYGDADECMGMSVEE